MPATKNLRYFVWGIISFSFFSINNANAQPESRNSIYLELASKGPVYSLNYDRIIREGNKTDYSVSAGFSIARNAVSFPVGIHFITDHHFQYGVTLIPYIDFNNHLIGSNKDETDKYLYIHPEIGYRYQPHKAGVFFKATVGPSIFLDPPSTDFWDMDPKLSAYGSVGFGISF
jgi:hypothetical protein